MKIINEYRFKNKKTFRTWYVNKSVRKQFKLPKCDNICFDYCDTDGIFSTGLYLRPDEALLIAKQLIDAVYKVTGAYEEKLLKGSYGYKETSL